MNPTLTRVIRLDSLPASQTFFTDEGYLRDRPILTSIGIFEYTNSDGSVRRELRLPEEVFDPESLKSYVGKPIIITHEAGLIDKDNVRDEQIGTILSEGIRDGDDVRADIVIHDTDAMKRFKDKELSLGYNLDLDETPGVWKGQPYDAIQRNIRINHLALVQDARAGDQARLNIDSRNSNSILKGGKKAMSVYKRTKKSTRTDSVLSPEELKKAIEAYKAKKAARESSKTDEDDDEKKVINSKPLPVADNEEEELQNHDEENGVEEKVAMLKDRRNRRDVEEEPTTLGESKKTIARQDEDIDMLFDIIDTLLAEKAFDDATEEMEDTNKDEDDETLPTEENEDDEDGEEEDVDVTDEDDEEEEENLDDDEEPDENCDDDEEEPIPTKKETLNTDSVDRIVKERVAVGMIGRTLNLDGLENMPLMAAKKKVIKAVRPNLRLDGKSKAFINAAFKLSCDDVNSRARKSTSYQAMQMFNADSRDFGRRTVDKDAASRARERMIARQRKNNLKEDK